MEFDGKELRHYHFEHGTLKLDSLCRSEIVCIIIHQNCKSLHFSTDLDWTMCSASVSTFFDGISSFWLKDCETIIQ